MQNSETTTFIAPERIHFIGLQEFMETLQEISNHLSALSIYITGYEYRIEQVKGKNPEDDPYPVYLQIFKFQYDAGRHDYSTAARYIFNEFIDEDIQLEIFNRGYRPITTGHIDLMLKTW